MLALGNTAALPSCHARRRNLIARAAADSKARADVKPGAPPTDPFASKLVYRDNFFDAAFIKIYSEKMAAQLPGLCRRMEFVRPGFSRPTHVGMASSHQEALD